MSNKETLIQICNLKTHFFTKSGTIRAVDDISFSLNPGETLALVGESGCGKTVTGLSLLRLIQPPGKIVSGEILCQNRDLLKLSEKEMRRLRGHEIAMIFQETMSSLNPVYMVGNQIVEALKLHQRLKGKAAWDKAVSLLKEVGLASPEQRARCYPHQLSGGMRQRVLLAIALSCRPALLIADEPTSALDVTIQADILELLKNLQQHNNLGILLISHDLAVVAAYAHRVAVMYLGKIVEYASASDLYQSPQHPYTRALLSAIPTPDPQYQPRRIKTKGEPPSPFNPPPGCPYHPRCFSATQLCQNELPTLKQKNNHWTRCWLTQ